MKLLLIHDEMLNAGLPIFKAHGNLPRVFVFDPAFIAQQGWRRRRLQFIADALSSIPAVRVFKGTLVDVVAAFKLADSVPQRETHVVTQATPNKDIQAWLATLKTVRIEFVEAPAFATHTGSLSRFSKYWSSVEAQWFPKGSLNSASQSEDSPSTRKIRSMRTLAKPSR